MVSGRLFKKKVKMVPRRKAKEKEKRGDRDEAKEGRGKEKAERGDDTKQRGGRERKSLENAI